MSPFLRTQPTRLSRRVSKRDIGLAALLAGALVAGNASPALAQSAPSTDSREASALKSVGLLDSGDQRTTDPATQSHLDPALGLVIPLNEEDSLQVIPDGSEELTQDPSGLLLDQPDSSFSYVLSDAGLGRSAGYSIIFDDAAPSEFRYRLALGESDVALELNDEGGLTVLTLDGTVANVVLPPWAIDARGTSVATSYRVEGSVLVQRVQHAGTAYPVIADPTFGCDAIWCTAALNRGETAAAADNAINGGLLCAFTGNFGPACAAVIGLIWAKANEARRAGKCVGLRWWRQNGAFMHPVIQAC